MKRTNIDFNEHELLITKTDELFVHYLKKPKTMTQSIKFINTNGICAVTGDWGNWIFCREFHPSANECASDHYWIEKLKISSCQDPYIFSSDIVKKEIKELLKEHEFSDEEKEWFEELEHAANDGEYAYIAKALDHPSDFEPELIPGGKELNYWFKVLLDAFDEICCRLKNNKIEIRPNGEM